ncbi:MAG: hypothetical protein ACYSW3_24585 [Planctomycetota bacterium]|jgi:hypothetical protein
MPPKTYAQEIDEDLNEIKNDFKDAEPRFRVAMLFLMRKQLLMLFDIRHHLKQIVDINEKQA